MDKRYVFGMMQIALQGQSDMGGNIDFVPTSHTDIRKHKQKFRKPLRVQLLLGISRLVSTLSRKFEIIQRIEVGLNCYICDIAAYIAGARKISSSAKYYRMGSFFCFTEARLFLPRECKA